MAELSYGEEQLFSMSTIDVFSTMSDWELNNYTDICDNLFLGNVNLININIPSNITKIGTRAFKNAVYLNDVSFNDSASAVSGGRLAIIGDEAFQNTYRLTSIILPSSVTTIGTDVFHGSGLTSITFAKDAVINNLSSTTFNGATKLETIIFEANTDGTPNNNYVCSSGALYDISMTKLVMYYSKDTSVTTFTVPATVTHIENNAFQYSQHLVEITFQADSGLTNIGENAFKGLNLVSSLSIPDTVTTIGENAFYGMSILTQFVVNDNNSFYSTDVHGVLFDKNKTILIQYPLGKSSQAYTIPNTVTTIKPRSLEFSKITSFSVETGSSNFADMSGVLYNNNYSELIQYPLYSTNTTYTIPDTVLTIQPTAFNDANILTTLSIPSTVDKGSIKAVEFQNMTSLASISTHVGPVYTNEYGTQSTLSYTYSYTPPNYRDTGITVIEGVLFDNDKEILIKYPCQKNDTSYTIMPEVNFIHSWAFSNASNLTTITFSQNQAGIYPYAFKNCSGLTNIYGPLGNSILNNAFENAFSSAVDNTTITFNTDQYLTIGTDAFKNSNINKVIYNNSFNLNPEFYKSNLSDINANLSDISNNKISFYGATGTNNVVDIHIIKKHFIPYYESLNVSKLWPSKLLVFDASSVYIGSYNTIADNVFKSCSTIRTVTCHYNLRRIEQSAFEDCSNLTSFEMPLRVNKIKNNVFKGTTNMTTFTMHDGIEQIWSNAFENSGITSIIFSTALTSIGVEAFKGCTELNQQLLIPPSITSIGLNAFEGCTSLTTVKFDETTNLDSLGLTITTSGEFFGATNVNIGAETHVFIITSEISGNNPFEARNTPKLLLKATGEFHDSYYTSTSTKFDSRSDIQGDYRHLTILCDVRNFVDFTEWTGHLRSISSLYKITITESSLYNSYLDVNLWIRHWGLYLLSRTRLLSGYFPELTHVTYNDTRIFGPTSRTRYDATQNRSVASIYHSFPSNLKNGCIINSNWFVIPSGSYIGNYSDKKEIVLDTVDILIEKIQNSISTIRIDVLNGKYLHSNAKHIVFVDSGIYLNGAGTGGSLEHQILTTSGPLYDFRQSILTVTIKSSGTVTIEDVGRIFPNLTNLYFSEISVPIRLGSDVVGPNISTIFIPRNIESINGEFARLATKLNKVVLEDNTLVEKFNIPTSLNQTFMSSPNLVDIYVDEWTFNSTRDSATYNNNGELRNAHTVLKAIGGENSYRVTKKCRVIGYSSIGSQSFFMSGYGLTMDSITLSTTITQIKSNAFENVTIEVENFSIPENVIIIEAEAFKNFIAPRISFLGNNLTTIGNSAFYQLFGVGVGVGFGVPVNATMDRTIAMPASVTSIGTEAFKMSKITNITFDSNSQITSIPDGMFEDCTELTSIIIPTSVRTIGDNAFKNCSRLASVTFQNNSRLVSIGSYAFAHCTDLSNIAFPTQLTSIGSHAFEGSGLTSLYFPKDTICVVNDYAFSTLRHVDTITFEPPMSDFSMNGNNIFFNLADGSNVTLNMTTYELDEYDLSYTVPENGEKTIDSNFFGKPSSNIIWNDTTPPNTPICFPKGTPVRTNLGDVAIDKLDPDIHTIRNKRIVAITQSQPLHTYIVNIEKDALSTDIPCRDTRISKEHKVFYKGEMIRAKDLVKLCKGVTKIPYTGEILYNVLMKTHDKMMINNLICETLHPENIMAKIHNGKYSAHEKNDLYRKLSSLIKNGDITAYNKFYKSL